MKEDITIRLYESPHQGACCESGSYHLDDSVQGWDYQTGCQLGLRERHGGFLMGRIDQMDSKVHVDKIGRYKVAIVCTLD